MQLVDSCQYTGKKLVFVFSQKHPAFLLLQESRAFFIAEILIQIYEPTELYSHTEGQENFQL